jgi:signal recognition particle subunit SRP54
MVLAELGGKLRLTLQKLGGNGNNNDAALTTETLNTIVSEISRALIESDVNVQLVMKLRTNIQKRAGELIIDNGGGGGGGSNKNTNAANINRTVQKIVVDELSAMLTPPSGGSDNDEGKTKKSTSFNKPYVMKRGKSNIILFVGLQGAGKTTSIAKYAHYYQKRGWKSCMVCADTFRAGAFDQLKQNATKLRIILW